jgi:hypothetical protein
MMAEPNVNGTKKSLVCQNINGHGTPHLAQDVACLCLMMLGHEYFNNYEKMQRTSESLHPTSVGLGATIQILISPLIQSSLYFFLQMLSS